MLILAHRGWWESPADKNSRAAFERAFKAGYGVETDIRDLNGTLVISHDPPRDGCMTLGEFLDLRRACENTAPLAINIKSDGLAPLLKPFLEKLPPEEYFLFDMNIPDTINYLKKTDMVVYTRHSDFETAPLITDKVRGIWMDGFVKDWITGTEIEKHTGAGRDVVLVSPELHGRDHADAWNQWKSASKKGPGRLMICTDFPDKAENYFS